MRNKHLENLITSIYNRPTSPKLEALRVGIEALERQGEDMRDYRVMYKDIQTTFHLKDYRGKKDESRTV